VGAWRPDRQVVSRETQDLPIPRTTISKPATTIAKPAATKSKPAATKSKAGATKSKRRILSRIRSFQGLAVNLASSAL
jgi:hypothetical protein